MRNIFIYFFSLVLMAACQNKTRENTNNKVQDTHEVIATEVIQTSKYTYLLVKENNKEQWIAVPKMNVEKGKTYYYTNAMEMNDFVSKELNRTFESVLFIETLSTEPEAAGTNKTLPLSHQMNRTEGKANPGKLDVSIEPVEGGISLAELYSHKEAYDGKTVLIKGVVSKFSPEIMQTNWIHIQDGTGYNGAFDLTATSNVFVNVGDTVVMEGVIYLNKDFGYGYFYDVIMEGGTLKEPAEKHQDI